MPVISIADAQVWAENTKLTLGNLDAGLADQVATQVLARIAPAYDISGWTTSAATPKLVKSIIAMHYVSWLYSKTYSENEGDNSYALRLLAMAEELILGIVAGTTDLIEVPDDLTTISTSSPTYYPNDLSSAQEATSDDPSLGTARFTMGSIF